MCKTRRAGKHQVNEVTYVEPKEQEQARISDTNTVLRLCKERRTVEVGSELAWRPNIYQQSLGWALRAQGR